MLLEDLLVDLKSKCSSIIYLFDNRDFLKLCKKTILENQNEYDIAKIIIDKLIEQFKDYNFQEKHLKLYLNSNFTKPKDVQTARANLKNFTKLLADMDILLDVEMAIELITSNENVKKALELVFNKYKFKMDSLNDYFEDFNFQTLILSYCDQNDIDFDISIDDQKGINNKDDYYISYYQSLPLLTEEELQELLIKYKNGSMEARNMIVERNMKLVYKVSSMYYKTMKNTTFMDIVQDGVLGLMKAIDKYDYTLGYKFSTYATWWIRQSIVISRMNLGRTIRLPRYISSDISKMQKKTNELTILLGRKPSINELSEALNFPVEKIDSLYNYSLDVSSLNAKVSDDEETEIGVFIPSKENIEDEVLYQDLNQKLIKLLNKHLNQQEADIILLRFGFIDGKVYGLKEIGEKYGLTRERIRQIINTSIKKLRESPNSEDLLDYLQFPNKGKEQLDQFRNAYKEKIVSYISTSYNIVAQRVEEQNNMNDSTQKQNSLRDKTIYKLIGCNYEQILKLIHKLSIEDQWLLSKVFGTDYDSNYKSGILNFEELSRLYDVILPNLSSQLEEKKVSQDTIKNQIIKSNKDVLQGYLVQQDYVRIVDCMKKLSFEDLIYLIGKKEALVVDMRLGLRNDNYSTTKIVAEKYDLSEDEVAEITRSTLLFFKYLLYSPREQLIDEQLIRKLKK